MACPAYSVNAIEYSYILTSRCFAISSGVDTLAEVPENGLMINTIFFLVDLSPLPFCLIYLGDYARFQLFLKYKIPKHEEIKSKTDQ